MIGAAVRTIFGHAKSSQTRTADIPEALSAEE